VLIGILPRKCRDASITAFGGMHPAEIYQLSIDMRSPILKTPEIRPTQSLRRRMRSAEFASRTVVIHADFGG